jgi:hypothetical protein
VSNLPEVSESREVSVAHQKIERMAQIIRENYMPQDDDPISAIANMAERILNADTFEDMFAGGDLEPTADLLDTGLHIESASFLPSDYQAGLPFYATFRGKKIADGTDFICNCGAWQVVTVTYMMLTNNWLPRNMYFHRSERATRAGYHPINILPWDEAF